MHYDPTKLESNLQYGVLASFLLVYGYEMVLPLQLEIPYLRFSLEGIIDCDEQIQSRLSQLEGLDEKIIHALEHIMTYQKIIKKAYAKKIILREF